MYHPRPPFYYKREGPGLFLGTRDTGMNWNTLRHIWTHEEDEHRP